ncbi:MULTISPECIES: hypothetical protein [unclassified Coleofasciculus]|uniref:hypothetical protein n=1 Tax=unclassified Coleofasciculus TaxID=2692782 RepID=UPI00187F05E3|nr:MULTISPECIES: hypothetical protein [unclassified Coleofasciculus]MBE9128591.1 hypothetical protein [Coleofasciculus sp. LEGE 07081]MBE9150681.1 hypothetical protein [Coleofasciculus sp. LEGE 07092]
MSLSELPRQVEAIVSQMQTQQQREAFMVHLSFLHREDPGTNQLVKLVVEYIEHNYVLEEYPSALEEIQAALDFALAE